MSRKFGAPVEFNQNQILDAVIHLVSSTPSSAKVGQLYFKTGNSVAYIMTANGERPLDAAALSDGSIPNSALATNPLLRSNGIGTQTASTISDLQTTVTGYSISSFAAATAAINAGSQRIANVAQATNASDAVPLSQVQSIAQAAAQGQNATKDAARLYASGNITLSGLQTIDGVATVAGDRILVANQTTTTNNNIWIASANSWAIAADCNVGQDWSAGSDTLITEGNVYAGAIFRQQTSGVITIGTSALSFVQISRINNIRADGVTTVKTGNVIAVQFGTGLSTSSGSLAIDTTMIPRKFSATITGDGATSSFQVNHNLGTTDIIGVAVRDSTGSEVETDDVPTSVNTVTVTISPVPASGVTYRVTISA